MTSKKSHTGKTVLILAMLLLMGMAIRLWPERRSVGLDISTLGRIDLVEFRAAQTQRALAPYERIFGPHSRAIADEVMTNGWIIAAQPAFELKPPIDWSSRLVEHRSWNYHLNCWQPLDSVLSVYDTTREERYLRVCLEVVLDWIASNRTYAEQKRLDDPPKDFIWYDMAVGLRVYRLAYLLDAACRMDIVDDATIEILWRSLLDHLSFLNDEENIRYHNNHGIYEIAGQLATARRFEWIDTMRAVSGQAADRFVRMIDSQFTAEGVHREHSPGYHQDVIDLLKSFRTAGLIPEVIEIDERIGAMEYALSWMISPSGNLVTFGDTDPVPASILQSDELASVHPVLAYRLSGAKAGAPPTTEIGVFPDSGYFALRTASSINPEAPPAEDSFLAQQAAFHSRTHKHADDLTFVWSDRGRDIFIDAGRYGYLGRTERHSELAQQGFWYSDPKRIYVESTHAHNTVEIDGQSYPRVTDPPYGSALRSWGQAGAISHVLTQVSHCGSIGHRRLLVLNPARWLIIIDLLDDSAGESHEFTQWFHAAPAFDVGLFANGTVRLADGSAGVSIYGASLIDGPIPLDPVRGRIEPRLQGWWSPRPYVLEPNAALGWRTTQTPQASFATLFVFDDQPDVDTERNGIDRTTGSANLRWMSGQQVHQLRIEGLVDQKHPQLVYEVLGNIKTDPRK